MVNATAFPDPYGWDNLANESNFNMINASITTWQTAAGGTGWIFATFLIIFLVPTIVYIRTKNLLISAASLIIINGFAWNYNIVSGWYATSIMLTGAILIGIGGWAIYKT